jgi:hypothetical protein
MQPKVMKMKKIKSLLRQKNEPTRKSSWSNRRSSRKSSLSNSLSSFKISKKATGIYSVQITDTSVSLFPKGNFILEISNENAKFNKELPTQPETPFICIGTLTF